MTAHPTATPNPYVAAPDPGRTAADELRLFTDEVYGRAPAEPVETHWRTVGDTTLPGGGARRQLVLELATDRGTAAITLLVQVPPATDRPEAGAPAFLGMNFLGNHACDTDPDILDLTAPATPEHGDRIHYDGRIDPADLPVERGANAAAWDLAGAAARGYAVVTWCYRQLGPDTPELFDRGLPRLFTDTGVDGRGPSEWGAIGVWAWTMSRVLDALAAGMVPEVDPATVITVGHSRLGKTALWAAATDERFAAAVSNDSGALGAALTRPVGETPADLARVWWHWFAPRFVERVRAGEPLPVDQPRLLAAIAPRPLYVASASEDAWADPAGEFASWQQASAAWPGGTAATAGTFPAPGTVLRPDAVPLGYHLRPGRHAVEPFDWAAWLDWADRWVVRRDGAGGTPI